MVKKGKEGDRLSALLASVTDDMVPSDYVGNQTDDRVRVERLILDLVRPDPIQPRRILPDRVHFAFHNQQMTPSQALREIVKVAQVAARQRGRPFSNLLELLPNGDEDGEDIDIKLTPEERFLTDIVNLAVTIRDDGQVNPITVVDVSQGVAHQFRIETGERRYWASWILRDFLPNYTGDGMIDCIIVPAERSSVFRQAKENTAREGLTAIAMARQAALLLLTVHGYPLPDHAIDNDFYRQALDLTLRGKREFTDAILNAMGGISRSYFSYYKALLNLSDEAMELADRHNLDEKQLRYVVGLDSEVHVELVRQIIDFNLSSKQIKQLIDAGTLEHEDIQKEEPSISRQSIQFAKSSREVDKTNGYELAQALLMQEKDVHMAIARLRAMRNLINAAEEELLNE